jgi:AcrR family transcriptional regulator
MTPLGRPRSFDRDHALRSAMEVFWARGYDATTLQDLLTAMGGLTPPSFYAAFGSKERVFLEAVELYQRQIGGRIMQAYSEPPTARAAIEAMLREGVNTLTTPGLPRGCLLIGAMNCTNPTIQAHLHEMRCQAPELIHRRLERGVDDGDVPAGLDLVGIASFYATVIHGLGVRARDEPSRAVLMRAVDGAMAAWDALVSPARTSGTGRKPARRSRRRVRPTR